MQAWAEEAWAAEDWGAEDWAVGLLVWVVMIKCLICPSAVWAGVSPATKVLSAGLLRPPPSRVNINCRPSSSSSSSSSHNSHR